MLKLIPENYFNEILQMDDGTWRRGIVPRRGNPTHPHTSPIAANLDPSLQLIAAIANAFVKVGSGDAISIRFSFFHNLVFQFLGNEANNGTA